ncbi:gliding motility lipoprotein GldH [Wenyingzhuangia sp. IMCC45467]
MNKIIYLIFFISCISCDANKEYDSYQSMKNGLWNLEEPVIFEVDIEDTKSQQNVFLNVRTDSQYQYRNLYVISKMILPNGAILQDTLEYEMADAFGNSLGDGMTDVKENKLYYLEKYRFTKKGTYTFEFYQAMRKRGEIEGLQELKGVTDVGLRIEKIQE